MKCPVCGSDCERDMVDVGVCCISSGPWGCPECHWVEDDFDDGDEELYDPDGKAREH